MVSGDEVSSMATHGTLFLAQRIPGGLSPFFPELLFGHIDSELAYQFREYSETLAAGQPIAIFVVFETR